MANIFLVNPVSSSRPTFSLGLSNLDTAARAAGHFSQVVQPVFRVPDAVDPNYIAMEVAEALGPLLRERRVGETDILGISVLSDTFTAAREIARWAKQGMLGKFTGEDFSPHVVVGGHLPTLLPETVLGDISWFDVAVLGEAEECFLDIVKALEGRGRWEEIKGAAWRKGGEIVVNPPASPPDLDSVPLPDTAYLERCISLGEKGGYIPVPVEVQRGCPGFCVFCDIAAFYRAAGGGKRVRFKSVPRVLEAMKPWVERGYERFFLYSDSVLAEPSFLLELTQEIEREGFKAALSVSGRPTDVLKAREVLKRVGESGSVSLERIEIGFEADSEHALRLLGKGTTPRINREVIGFLRSLREASGDPVEIDFDFILLSHPDMTMEDLEANIRFAAAYIPDDQEFAPAVVPYPKTPLWELLRRRGFKPDPERGYVIPYEFRNMIIQTFLEKLSTMTRRELLERLRRLVLAGDMRTRIKRGDW